jgi:hypothetical protein
MGPCVLPTALVPQPAGPSPLLLGGDCVSDSQVFGLPPGSTGSAWDHDPIAWAEEDALDIGRGGSVRGLDRHDLDGDGTRDLVLRYTAGPATHTYVYAGDATGDLRDPAGALWTFNDPFLNTSMQAGTVDSSGTAGLFVGEDGDSTYGPPGWSRRTGMVLIQNSVPAPGYVGPFSVDARVIGTDPTGDLGAGFDVADLNGDGIDDLVVPAPVTGNGEVYVFHGPFSGDLTPADADVTITGAPDLAAASGTTGIGFGPSFGTEVDAGGDFDGDGVRDLVVTAEYACIGCATDTRRGEVFVFLGPLTDGSSASADFSVCGADGDVLGLGRFAGDMDGDGADEIVVSSTAGGRRLGILRGGRTGRVPVTQADLEVGPAPGAYEAHALVQPQLVGDLTGDGRPDLGVSLVFTEQSIRILTVCEDGWVLPEPAPIPDPGPFPVGWGP